LIRPFGEFGNVRYAFERRFDDSDEEPIIHTLGTWESLPTGVTVSFSAADWGNVPTAPGLYRLTFYFGDDEDLEWPEFNVLRPDSSITPPVLQLVTPANGDFGTFAPDSVSRLIVTFTLSGNAFLGGYVGLF
jgi:hypothetical protein